MRVPQVDPSAWVQPAESAFLFAEFYQLYIFIFFDIKFVLLQNATAMTSHSESSSSDPGETNENTYQLGLFSQRAKNECIASYCGLVRAKTEMRCGTFYPRLKGLFPGEPDVADIIVLSKRVGEQTIKLKELNLSEIEVSELKVVKTSGKIDRKPIKENGKRIYVDDDYEEESGQQLLMQLPEDVEISLEYSTALELVFMRVGEHIRLCALIINNTEILG